MPYVIAPMWCASSLANERVSQTRRATLNLSPFVGVKSGGDAVYPLSVAGLIACKNARLFEAFSCLWTPFSTFYKLREIERRTVTVWPPPRPHSCWATCPVGGGSRRSYHERPHHRRGNRHGGPRLRGSSASWSSFLNLCGGNKPVLLTLLIAHLLLQSLCGSGRPPDRNPPARACGA